MEITIPFVEVENDYIEGPSWMDDEIEGTEEPEEIAVASEEDS